MKYKVFNKFLKETKIVDFKSLQKISNATWIKAEIDSNQAYYQDSMYFIYRANLEGEDEQIILTYCD